MHAATLRTVAHDALRRALRAARQRAETAGTAPMLRVLDGTAGNGHDTLFLAQCVGEPGEVWAFDVQEAALAATRARLEEHGLAGRVRLVLDGHQHLDQHLPPKASIDGAMFNLGYLPGGEHSRTTHPQSTLAALHSTLSRMASGALLSVHIYTGHAGGDEECAVLLSWIQDLPHPQWHVLHCATSNKTLRAEHLLLISKN